MRRLRFIFPLLLLAAPLFAGMTYRFQSTTDGVAKSALSGTAEVDAGKVRVQFAQGDNLIFKNGSIVISTDGGKTLNVLDPSTHTYFELAFDKMVSSMGALSMMNVTNGKVSSKDAGDGGTIEGYPTRKNVIDTSYDLELGTGEPIHVVMHNEVWTTDKISGENASFMQTKNFHTGFPAIDKLFEAQTTAMRGRFPLKQTMTMSMKSSAFNMNVSTNANVTDIKMKDVPASQFAIPAGYQKTESPLERMKKMSRSD